jgi:hypothetical protein
VNAAALGQKIALYGYDKWRLLRVRKKVVTFALVAEEGFAWPIWDRDVGPYTLDEATGRMKGCGEVRIRTFSRNQVIWEPGLEFDESPWHGVQQGMTVDAVKGPRRLPRWGADGGRWCWCRRRHCGEEGREGPASW